MRSAPPPDPFSKVCIKAGSIAACCPFCNCPEFRVARGKGEAAVYQCCACLAEMPQAELILQLRRKALALGEGFPGQPRPH